MAKIVCKGTKLELSDGMTFNAVSQILTLNGPSATVEHYIATTLDSGAGHEKGITGFTDFGQVSGECYYDPADARHKDLISFLVTPVDDKSWKTTFSDTKTIAFTGICTQFTPKVELSDGLKADFTIEVDGAPTYPA